MTDTTILIIGMLIGFAIHFLFYREDDAYQRGFDDCQRYVEETSRINGLQSAEDK